VCGSDAGRGRQINNYLKNYFYTMQKQSRAIACLSVDPVLGDAVGRERLASKMKGYTITSK
jgi:hypothetical protein